MFGELKVRELMNFEENSSLREKFSCLESAERKEEEKLEWKKKYEDLHAQHLKLIDENSCQREEFACLKVEHTNLDRAKRKVEKELTEWKESYVDLHVRKLKLDEENFQLRGVEQREREIREKFLELRAENRDLNRAKQNVGTDSLQWKRKHGKLIAEISKLGKENSRLAETQKAASEYRERFHELEAVNRDLLCEKERVEVEILQERNKYMLLEARVSSLVNDNSHLIGIERKELEARNKVAAIEAKNRDIEHELRRSLNEVQDWKKKHGELESQILSLVEEKSCLTSRLADEKKASEFEDRFRALEALNRDLLRAKTRTEEEVLEEREKYVALEHSHLVEIERKEMEARNKVTAIEVKNKDIEHEWRRSQDEVHDWKEKYGKLESQILRLVEENSCLTSKLAFENSRLVQIEKKEGKLLAKLVQFEVENKDLEHAKRDAEEEVLVWIKRCRELKAHECKLMEENSNIMQIEKKVREMGEKLVELEMEYRNLECANCRLQDEIHELEVANRDLGCAKASVQEVALEWERKYGELLAQDRELVKENSRLTEIEKKAREFEDRFYALEAANMDLVCAKTRA